MRYEWTITLCFALPTLLHAGEFHVSVDGADSSRGTASAPFRTIQRAADLAQPGDVITVHEGVYREEVTPPRGGRSDEQRITYRAAPGEEVTIKGSEVVKGWVHEQGGVWKVELPNGFFGDFNPYADEVKGDWFNPKGRKHHTGCVYLNGTWLTEAATREALFSGENAGPKFIVNLAWFRFGDAKIIASEYSAFNSLRIAKSDEPCGTCLGYIADGSWVSYESLDFGLGVSEVAFRMASPGPNALVEIRLDGPSGELLGTCRSEATGGWQQWKTFEAEITPVQGKRTICLVFRDPDANAGWFSEVSEDATTIWAKFGGIDPNKALTEINVRQTVFYPREPFRNYITVRGFTMLHAAPKWAPPTAEQMGLIGTHWSKGWIIEDNEVSHSINVGISLGKYGDQFDNAGATAQAYLDSIDRARSHGWNRATIGSHIVRNNEISWCEQAGVVGSMGASFSTVTGNHIHHIYTQRRFTGAEMAGIKFHAPIDMLIKGNRIHDAFQGIWLDWMTQGTRVTRNLLYRNDLDLFLEVNHGPFVIDNNLFLSNLVKHHSQGGAYVHNLFGGVVGACTDQRHTPYFKAHSTQKVADHVLDVGDDRFYNNLFNGHNGSHIHPGWWEGMKKHPNWRFGYGLWIYDTRPQAPQTGGNIYYDGALPHTNEHAAVVEAGLDVQVEESSDEVFLHITIDPEQLGQDTPLVNSTLLGRAQVPDLPFETPAGRPFTIDTDYYGRKRDGHNPRPGPFEDLRAGRVKVKVW